MPGNGFTLDPDFRKLWIGQAISQIGSNITGVGLPLTAVLVLKASPLQIGFLSGAGAAAVLVFAFFAGAWVDRLPRRPILIATDPGRAAKSAGRGPRAKFRDHPEKRLSTAHPSRQTPAWLEPCAAVAGRTVEAGEMNRDRN